MLIKYLLKSASQKLSKISDTPLLDVELLLAHVLDKDRAYLYANPEETLSVIQEKKFNKLLKERLTGKPIAYILKRKSFWNIELEVNQSVLIPRPETELLVELVLQKYSDKEKIKLLDLGTGSGAIALAIAKARPSWQIYAIDKSIKALNQAKKNCDKLGILNVVFINGDWGEALNAKFDVVVSNPPYIAKDDPALKTSIRFEPKKALIGGNDGLIEIRKIVKQAKNILTSNGILFIEHGYDQSEKVKKIFLENGYLDIQRIRDLSGNYRVSAFEMAVSRPG